jgi:glycosyltransferase involved in cell wall biosynthesis
MMPAPLVSVIVPAYNAAHWIAETIRSVQAQSLDDWELIIINDGSSDDTASVIETFLSDKRIQLVHQSNSGVCKTRNHGFTLAKGKYIALLDADDLFLPENLKEKITALESNSDARWTYSNLKLINEKSEKYGPDTQGKSKNILQHLLRWNGEVIPGPCSNLVFHRSVLETGIRFDPQFSTAADQDFCMSLAASYSSVFIPETLAAYRILPNSMSRNIAVMEKDHIAVYEKAAAKKLFNSWAFQRKCFSNLYLILAGSWWVNGQNKMRGILFMIKAFWQWPPVIFRLIKKAF